MSQDNPASIALVGRSKLLFTLIAALTMSVVALAIDAVLPAYTAMAENFALRRESDLHWVISILFLGMMLGQLFIGPLSDDKGRKPLILGSLVLYVLGALIAVFSANFAVLLLGRFIQGLGCSGPRVLIQAMIRDQFKGTQMAKVSSTVISIFILMPCLAPFFGQIILSFGSWHMIFLAMALIALMTGIIFMLLQPETLHSPKPFRISSIIEAALSVFKDRTSRYATLAGGAIFGALIGYINLSSPILKEIYGVGDSFAFWFGLTSSAVALASMVNSRFVERLGMYRMCMIAMLSLLIFSACAGLYCWLNGNQMSFALFIIFIFCSYLMMGTTFGNYNAMAMENMGHIAGAASAVIASGMTLFSMLIAALIAELHQGSVLTIMIAFVIISAISLLFTLAAK